MHTFPRVTTTTHAQNHCATTTTQPQLPCATTTTRPQGHRAPTTTRTRASMRRQPRAHSAAALRRPRSHSAAQRPHGHSGPRALATTVRAHSPRRHRRAQGFHRTPHGDDTDTEPVREDENGAQLTARRRRAHGATPRRRRRTPRGPHPTTTGIRIPVRRRRRRRPFGATALVPILFVFSTSY